MATGTVTGTVRQIIEFKGQDDTTAVANKVKKSVEGIADAADKTSKATSKINGKGLEEIQQKSGDVESALKGISDFAGTAKGQVSQLGDSFGAVEGIMRLLPGPIGLVATGIAAAGLAIYALGKTTSETAAKLQSLGDSRTQGLADNLKISVDEAIQLQQAIGELNDKRLTPSLDLFKAVAAQAEAMGKNGGEAQVAFAAAIGKGSEELKKFGQEFGKVQGLAASSAALANSLGLDADALGLSKQLTQEAEGQLTVKRSIALIQEEQIEVATREVALVRARALEVDGFNVVQRLNAGRQKVELEEQITAGQRIIENERATLVEIQRNTLARQAETDAVSLLLSRAGLLEAQAAGAASTSERSRLRSEASTARQLGAIKELTAFDNLHGKTLTSKLQIERNFLESKVAQGQAAKQAEADAKEQERKAAAAAGAARARAAREAKLRDMAKFASEEIADLAAMEATSKQQANEAVRANVKALEDQAAAQQRLVEARIGGTEDPAVKARLEIANIEAQRDRDLAVARKESGITEIARLAKLQAITIESTTKTVAIQTAADAKIKESAEKVAAAQRDSADAALSIVGAAAQAAQAYAGPNGLAGAIGQAVTSTQTLLKGWSTTESNTSGVIGAIGAVTASVVDGEKTKAAILGVMELALVAASFPDPAKMAAHGAAAVIYGGIAGGLFGGGAATSSGAAPGGLTTTTGTTAQGQQQQGAGTTTVINFVAPLATRYEIGKSVVEAQKAAKAYASASPGV